MLSSATAAELLAANRPLSRIEIANEGVPRDAVIRGVDLDFCHLYDVWMRTARISESRIRHSLLERVTLRNATLQQVDFTGSQFVDCNLAFTEFVGCTLWYCEFHNCQLNYESILRNLPSEENLRRRVLHSLRNNAVSQGDSVRANDLLLLELESERRDLFNCFTHASQYYKDRYSGIAQIQAFAAWIVHWLQRICWGYGLRLRNLVTTIVVLLVALSAITYNVGGIYHIASESKDRSLNVFESAYVTTITFCTVGYGDITPASGIGRSCSMITAVIGVVAWGFLVAAVYRRLAR